jgi:hypothetical protein
MLNDKTSLRDVENYLRNEYFHESDPNMDGWTTFARKQNIYRVKFLAEELLEKCSTYNGEEEWLQEYRTQLAFQELGHCDE